MKKKLVIGLSLIFILLVLGYFLKFISQKNNTSFSAENHVAKIEDVWKLEEGFKQVNSLVECQNIVEQIKKLGPYRSGDETVTPSVFEYNTFLNICKSFLALKQNQINLCDDNRECLLSFISRANPQTNLEEIDCRRDFKDIYQTYCLSFEATAKLDPKICLNIDGKNILEIRKKNECLRYFAFRNHDSSFCDQQDEENDTLGPIIQKCKDYLGVLEKNNPIFCHDIESFDFTYPGDEKCLDGLAIYNQKHDQCSDTSFGSFEHLCQRYAKTWPKK